MTEGRLLPPTPAECSTAGKSGARHSKAALRVKVKCPNCFRPYEIRGMGSHLRFCKSQRNKI